MKRLLFIPLTLAVALVALGRLRFKTWISHQELWPRIRPLDPLPAEAGTPYALFDHWQHAYNVALESLSCI
jgi:hypothetical protein